MAQELINGITFDNENVTSRNDSLFWHYHLTKNSETYSSSNNGIYVDYNDGLAVTTSGLEMTVRAGIGVAYGRNVEVETPTILAVGTSEIGILVIDIDLNQVVNEQVSLLTTTSSLIQEDLSASGLQYQIPIGTYDSTSGVVVFTRTANDMTLDYIIQDLSNDFVTLNSNQIINGNKTFTQTLETYAINMNGRKLDTEGGDIDTSGGTITTASITSNGQLRSNGGFSNGGVDIGTYVNSTGDLVSQGNLRAKLAQLNGLTGDGTAIDINAGFSTLGQSFNITRAYYGNGNLLYRAGRSGDSSPSARYVHMSIYGTSGGTDASLRAYGNSDTGVRHVTASDGSLRLAYASEVTRTLEATTTTLELQRANIELDIALLEEQVEEETVTSRQSSVRKTALSLKQELLEKTEKQIEINKQLLEESERE